MICVGNAWLKAQPAAAAGDEPQLGIGPLNGHRCTAWGAGRSPIGVCATCSKTSACGATWRETPTLPSRLGETRYDAVISDEYRGGAPEGLALAQRMVRLAQRLDVDQGVDPILFEVPLIIYGTNSSRPPPPGVQLITNRPDEVLSKPDQQGRGDQTLTVLERSREIDGNLYFVLDPAAKALEGKHPLAATLLRRAMVEDTLEGAKAKRYRHAARHLLECRGLEAGIADHGGFETHEAFVAGLRARHGRKTGFWSQVTELGGAPGRR